MNWLASFHFSAPLHGRRALLPVNYSFSTKVQLSEQPKGLVQWTAVLRRIFPQFCIDTNIYGNSPALCLKRKRPIKDSKGGCSGKGNVQCELCTPVQVLVLRIHLIGVDQNWMSIVQPLYMYCSTGCFSLLIICISAKCKWKPFDNTRSWYVFPRLKYTTTCFDRSPCN